VTDTEPTAVGAHLQAAADALRQRAAAAEAKRPPRPELVADLAEQRAAGMAAMRAEAWQAMVPRRFHGADVAHFAEPLAAKLQHWADDPAGRNLVLMGPVGTGKTHAAVAAVRYPHHRGLRVAFHPVVELLDLLRPGGPEGAWDQLATVDLLVLDDLGTERATDWTGERLGALVNRRWLEERPIVATTNLQPKELEDSVGQRTYSRLVGGAVGLTLGGTDRRRARA
jgi:DNA replication protein DnaC